MNKVLRITLSTFLALAVVAILVGFGFSLGLARGEAGNFWPGALAQAEATVQDNPHQHGGAGATAAGTIGMESMMMGNGDMGLECMTMGNGGMGMESMMMANGGMGMGSMIMGGTGMVMGSGMAGHYGMMASGDPRLKGLEPLALPDLEAALEAYLDGLEADLAIGEIMIFDNHAYAQLLEKDTGIGALEVLVDPVTLAVTPEPGPGMMWNLKYGPMGLNPVPGMMGAMGNGRMHGTAEESPQDISPEMAVSPEQAIESAQRYLDQYLPGASVGDHVTPFYGYYTLHIERGGETVGMLSVHGTSRQVFVHSWHGQLMSAEAE